MPSQGYLTIAFDKVEYLMMAINLAKSLKYLDPKRRRCLIHNERIPLPPDIGTFFDDIILLETDPLYVGCMNKIRVQGPAPYDETMYIDADCLLVKADIDRHWKIDQCFGMTGEKCTSGVWNNLNIDQYRRDYAVDYIVRMNSGVFYFDKSDQSAAFFERMHELFHTRRDHVSNIHQNRAGQYADEPFFGIAMGEFGLEPVGGTAEDGSWMVSTWRARRCRFDPALQVSELEKPVHCPFGLPFLARQWVRHSPTIAHFIGLKPRRAYREAVASLDRALALAG